MQKFSRFCQVGDTPGWEIVVMLQCITKGFGGGGKGEGLERSQADSLATFPPQLGPSQARGSNRVTILPCFGKPSSKPGRPG